MAALGVGKVVEGSGVARDGSDRYVVVTGLDIETMSKQMRRESSW